MMPLVVISEKTYFLWVRFCWLASCGFDECGNDVSVFNKRIACRAGFYVAGPADDKTGVEACIVESPFCEGEAGSLLGCRDEERVVGEFVAIDEV